MDLPDLCGDLSGAGFLGGFAGVQAGSGEGVNR